MRFSEFGATTRWLLPATAVAALIMTGAYAQAATSQAVSKRLVIQAIPAIVNRAQLNGPHQSSATIKLVIGMKLRHVRQLNAFLRNVQNPASPAYHQFLTPKQFTRLYGPTSGQVQVVIRYLRSQGLLVRSVSRNRTLIRAVGITRQIEQTFGIRINDYTFQGRRFFAPGMRPRLPSEIASYVQAVIGLSNAAVLHPMHRRATDHTIFQNRRHKIRADSRFDTWNGYFRRGRGSSAAANANTTPSGFSPQQIATAYTWPSITNTANANGVTIAIATAQSTNLSASDYDGFWNQYGLPTHTIQMINVDGSATATAGTGETTIDVERSGAMAPGANITVYDANNASLVDFTDTYNKIVTDNTAQVMTTSWGTAEANMSSSALQSDDNIFKQAVAQGISVFAAAGDNGSSDGTTNSNTTDYPSSDPYVLAAGGTNLVLTSSNTISSETAWSSGGGAASSVYSEPSWQVGQGVPQNGKRNTADLSMDADPNTGYSVLLSGSWAVYGGTSFVAPELAGLWAVGVSNNSGTRLGQANKATYNDANTSNYANDFNDVTSGSNGAFSSGTGWDHPTGWGTPIATSLITDIVAAAGGTAPPPPPPPTNTTPVASNGAVTTNENQAISGTLSASDSDGDTLTFAIVSQPAHGSTSITNAATGAFTYTPANGFYGSDSFTFQATDSAGNVSNTATETITVKQVVANACPSGFTKYTGNLASSGNYQYQPNGNYYHAGSGAEKGTLSGPSSTDFDLYLYQWSSWWGWQQIASSTGSTSSESITYAGSSGYYIWEVYSYSGSGNYTFCLSHP